jgi:hypothetical protein
MGAQATGLQQRKECAMTISRKLAAVLAAPALSLAGCYVVPVVDPQGNVQYYHYPIPPAADPAGAPPVPFAGPMPVTLPARLYPANDIANQTGVITGTVTNLRTGKGRFQLQYQGETLVGEATRQGSDDKRGIASAYGSGGTFMQCEYQMNTPVQGAGTCTFSNGAQYRVHLGR